MNLRKNNRARFGKIAQSATELAIFGSILLYVSATIMRTGFNSTHQLNQQLKVWRMAMAESFRTSEGHYSNADDSSARNTAQVLLVEDRLALPDSSRAAAVDRMPLINFGSGTMTNLLYYMMDWGEFHALPVTDFIVNGQRFVFSVGAWREMRPTVDNLSNQLSNGIVTFDAWEDCSKIVDSKDRETCEYFDATAVKQAPLCNSTASTRGWCWEPNCRTKETKGCLLMYRRIDNCSECEEFCYADDKPTEGCQDENIPVENRFDLDFDGVADVDSDLREFFSWQWYMVPGVSSPDAKKRLNLPSTSSTFFDGATTKANGRPQGVTGIWTNSKHEKIDVENTSLDVDGDGEEEWIIHIKIAKKGEPNPWIPFSIKYKYIKRIRYLDYQEGDLNMDSVAETGDTGQWIFLKTANPPVCPPHPTGTCTIGETNKIGKMRDSFGTCAEWKCKRIVPGLKDDLEMFSFTRQGTYHRHSEGKIYNGQQYIRDETLTDHIDIIQRSIQISKDTGRFCDENGDIVAWTGSNVPNYTSKKIPNPIEVCNECFSPTNISKTCFDQNLLKIYVRSRIKNLFGRKWITKFMKSKWQY